MVDGEGGLTDRVYQEHRGLVYDELYRAMGPASRDEKKPIGIARVMRLILCLVVSRSRDSLHSIVDEVLPAKSSSSSASGRGMEPMRLLVIRIRICGKHSTKENIEAWRHPDTVLHVACDNCYPREGVGSTVAGC